MTPALPTAIAPTYARTMTQPAEMPQYDPHWEYAYAKGIEAGTAKGARELWLAVVDQGDKKTQEIVKAAIDHILEDVENATDLAAVRLALAERAAGAQPIPAEQLWAELGLDDEDSGT